jgi:hypothetical protein
MIDGLKRGSLSLGKQLRYSAVLVVRLWSKPWRVQIERRRRLKNGV